MRAELASRVEDQVKQVRNLTDKLDGKVRITIDGIAVSHTVTRTYEWDSGLLENALHYYGSSNALRAAIKRKLSIDDKSLKNLPDDVRKYVLPARTIKHSAPKVAFEEDEA